MVAQPDSPLEQQRALVAEIQARLNRESLILEGMERMAAFTPATHPVAASAAPRRATSSGSKGRQPGAISKRWRDVFALLVRNGNRFNDDAVVEAVRRLEGREMRRSEVRRLFDNHRANGLVAFHDDGAYSVTQYAIDKFDLGRNGEGPPENSEGPSRGGVAERLIASDSNSDGASLSPAPVGSNPTASVPIAKPWETSTSPVASTSTPQWPWQAPKGG